MVCTFIDTLCKYTTCIMRCLRRCSPCYWSAVDCDGQATVVEVGWRRCCLENCWECACSSLGLARWGVLFNEAWWSRRVSWSGWFPLKSLPTCSCHWLHCDFQYVPREHVNCTAGNVGADLSESSSWLTSYCCGRFPHIYWKRQARFTLHPLYKVLYANFWPDFCTHTVQVWEPG
jgi:hypothetical protein